MHRWYHRMRKRPSASPATEPGLRHDRTRGDEPRVFFAFEKRAHALHTHGLRETRQHPEELVRQLGETRMSASPNDFNEFVQRRDAAPNAFVIGNFAPLGHISVQGS